MKELSLEDAHDSVDDHASRAEKRDRDDGRRNLRDYGKRACFTDRR